MATQTLYVVKGNTVQTANIVFIDNFFSTDLIHPDNPGNAISSNTGPNDVGYLSFQMGTFSEPNWAGATSVTLGIRLTPDPPGSPLIHLAATTPGSSRDGSVRVRTAQRRRDRCSQRQWMSVASLGTRTKTSTLG